jgi:hypothetical protein
MKTQDIDYLYDEAKELEYLKDCSMFYACPDYSPAELGEQRTADEVEDARIKENDNKRRN